MKQEKALENAVIELLHRRGHYAIGIKSGKIQQTYHGFSRWIHLAPKGTPDVFACIHGKFVGIELKKDEKEKAKWERQYQKFEQTRILTDSAEHSIVQHQCHDSIRDSKGIVLVCGSIDELIKWLDSFDLAQS